MQLPLVQILLAKKSGLASIDRSLPFRQIIEFEATLPVGQYRLGGVEGAFDQNPPDRFAGGGIDHGATQGIPVGLCTIRSRLRARTDLPLKRHQSEPCTDEQPGEHRRRSGGRKPWSVGKSGHGSDTTDPEGTYSLLDSQPGGFVAWPGPPLGLDSFSAFSPLCLPRPGAVFVSTASWHLQLRSRWAHSPSLGELPCPAYFELGQWL